MNQTSPVVEINDENRGLLGEYEQFLSGKAKGTMDAYLRTARHLIGWVTQLPESFGQFQPQQLTRTTVEQYLTHLEQEGLGLPHRTRVKSTISNFALFLIEEKGLLQRNPTRSIELPPVPLLRSEHLLQAQRSILGSLVKQEGDQRGAALFALGYWAGCRVSEVSRLQMAHTHVGPTQGWLHVGEQGSKGRDIDLLNAACQPLYTYLQATSDTARTYVFTSQRSGRLTEEGIYYWFRTLKAQATEDQREVIADLTFHDLRHDFAHRAREAAWSLEEVAYYLGRGTKNGVTAFPVTPGSLQVSREQVQQKLKHIKG
jgi:site-specific recombinase XerD